MYQINLYPEFQEKQRAKKRRTIFTAVLTVVAGLQVVLIGSQFLNASMLDEQITALDSELPRLEQFISVETQSSPEILVAKDLLDIRRARTDWAPSLASLSHAVDRPVFLVKLSGNSSSKNTPAGITISGEQKRSKDQLEQITGLMNRLRSNQAFHENFSSIALGKIKGGDSGAFVINCSPEEASQ
jgi:Tfp pilus assembly protein PilN